MLRLKAISGGVPIWHILLSNNHDCIHRDMGEHGDALGQAVVQRDVELKRFLLEEGM